MKKYIQSEETRYANNEYESMPSLDFSFRHNGLTKENMNRVDWNMVEEICKKYGFGYKIFKSTYCSRVECVIYLKTDISVEQYNELNKAYDNSREDKERYWAMCHSYDDTFRKLHDCVHELDEQTDLMFECGWSGNCGLFGSDDVRRKSYSFGSHLSTWSYITDRYNHYCYSTPCFFSKGIYVMIETDYIKPQKQNSPELADFEPKLLEIARGLLSDEFVADFECGKRQCDTDTEGYRALVVRYKKTNEYCCMIRFFRDNMGKYTIYHAKPLCGESDWEMDWQNPTEDLKYALGSCAA